MVQTYSKPTFWSYLRDFFWILIGAFLAAVSIEIFLLPNYLIDGGIVGIALILERLTTPGSSSYYLLILNIPFIFLAFRYIRRTFVIHMTIATLFFAFFMYILHSARPFFGDPLEIIVFGGAILGFGVGLIIRYGGCLDGTEILGIIINRKMGFTVGQVVMVANVFIFGAYGMIFKDWHIAFQSLMTYFVAFKMIDLVIVGLDELKSVMIITGKTSEVAKAILGELGLGMTIIPGKGGFSGAVREIIFIIVERLDFAELKEIVMRTDPEAFMAVENLHEVISGKQSSFVPYRKRPRKKGLKRLPP